VRTLFLIALRNLVAARRRSMLLGSAIGIVSMALVLMLSLANGIEDSMVDGATALSAGHVNVAGFYKTSPTDAAPLITDKDAIRAVVERHVQGIDYVLERHRGWGKIISPTGTVQSAMTGIDVANEERFLSRLQGAKESSYFEGGSDEIVGDPRRLAQPHTLLLFESHARRLGVKVGDQVTIQIETFGGQTNTIDTTVVAVAADIGLLSSFSVILPTVDVLELYQIRPDTTGALWVYLDDIERAEVVRAQLHDAFKAENYRVMDHVPAPFFFKFDTVLGEDWTGQKIDLTIWEDEVSYLKWVLQAFDVVLWFLVVILVSVIGVGIMNTLYNAVRERTREIGTLRAIGMRRSRVLMLVLLEALTLGVLSSGLGALLGAGLALGVDALQLAVPNDAMRAILLAETVHLAVEPRNLVSAVVALSLFASSAAVWPAARAARLSPVSAMGHIE
jgi:putative ABC transport system permease protein